MATQGIRLGSLAITMAVLARFLSSEAFGIAAIAASIQVFLNAFRDGGLANALIQRPEIDESHRSSAFWVNLASGSLLAALLMLSAPWVARYYGEEILEPIVTCMAVPLVAQVLGAVQEALLRKELRFGKLLIAHATAAVASSVAAIIAAASGWGVWSLIVRIVLMPTLLTTACWSLSTWRPQAVFRWRAVADLWSVGMFMFLSALASFGLTQLDGPIIASVAGVSAAGIFFMARQGALTIVQEVTNAVARVLFPFFSVIQHDPEKIGRAFHGVSQTLALLGSLIVGGVIGLAPEMVAVVLGAKWLPAVPVAQALSLQGLILCITFPAAQILNARGRTRALFVIAVIRGAFILAAFAVGARWGALGAAIAWTSVRTLSVVPVLIITTSEIGMRPRRLVLGVAGPTLLALISVAVTRLAAYILDMVWGPPTLATLVVLSGTLLSVYILLVRLTMTRTLDFLWTQLQRNR